MKTRRTPPRAAIDLSTRHQQERLFSSVADLARAGAHEPMEDALERIDHAARDLRDEGGHESRQRLEQIRGACDRLSESLTGEQLRVMRDLAELQSRIQQRRRLVGAPVDTPSFDRRG
jgi:hypothetical protein